ncbi:hypothetical protein ACFVIM_03390 [Streptomyces sp. NPDC057638]|uniref:hypothetical protein n=1 Tax=Streptomyces sp. NPDC057638 TaxID=3346190 RepID=UPI0036C906E8
MPAYPPPLGPPPPPPPPANRLSGKQKATLGCGGLVFVVLAIGLIGSTVSSSPRTVSKSVPGPTVTKTVTVTVTPEAKAPEGATQPKKPRPVGTSAATSAANTDTDTDTARLPNLVGQQLQAAQDAAQAAGFYLLSSYDATGADRMQVLDRNWKVCSQSPAPGAADPSRMVDFGAVKIEETCP